MKSFIRLLVVFLLSLSFNSVLTGQTKISYEAEILKTHEIYKDISVLKGNVIFSHEGTLLYCDSAYFYQKESKINAFSNIRIKVSDTLDIYGDTLIYDGNTKIAEIINNVRLVDNNTTLTTNYLNYNRISGIASYFNGGKIVDKENVLTSKIGHYFTSKKQFFFKNDVKLTNPKYNITSDTLMFNTSTEIAYFFGPTVITSKDNKIYCENGWYNTKTDVSRFSKNSWIQTKNQYLEGDSIVYDRNIGLGIAYNNVVLIDTVKNIVVKGNYIENNELLGKSLITDNALAIFIDKQDSLFIHGDTLRAKYDTLDNVEYFLAYNKVKFFKSDIQGMCDSLSFLMIDSIMNMYHKPVLWNDKNQLTADTISLIIGNNVIKELYLKNNSFIIEESDSNKFNQAKGKYSYGYFMNNELYKVEVKGNSETIYYMKEDGSEDIIGINKAISSDLLILFKDKKVQSITFINKPEGTMYPVDELPVNERTLKGFNWQAMHRPLVPLDVFKWK